MVGPCGIIVCQPQLIAENAPLNCYSSLNSICTQQVLLLHKTWVSSPVLLRLFSPEFCSFCFVLFHFCVSAYLCILLVLPLLNSYSPVLSVEVETEIIILLVVLKLVWKCLCTSFYGYNVHMVGWVIVLNVTSNNISVISWRSA